VQPCAETTHGVHNRHPQRSATTKNDSPKKKGVQ
jgi:hypothetical protein